MYLRKSSIRNPPDPESNKRNKIKLLIIAGLCAAAIILFYFYVTFRDGTTESKISTTKINLLLQEEISNDIDSIAFTFGIHKEWIKNFTQKNKNEKTISPDLLISKEIRIPNDLPMIDLNFEYSNYIRQNNYKEKVIEDPKTKSIYMEIYPGDDSAGKPTGILKIIYNDSLKRPAADVCFILDSIDAYPSENVDDILRSTEEFSVFLPLRNDKADYQSKIIESKRDYLIKFLIGDENDVTADFKIDMKESVWKAKIKSIAMNFQNSGGIILKSKTEFADFEKAVKEEFARNNIKVYKDTLFFQHRIGEQKVNSIFSDLQTLSKSGKKNLFYSVNFSPDEFNYFDQNVYKLKKLGYKFLNFSDLIKKINKMNAGTETGNADPKIKPSTIKK